MKNETIYTQLEYYADRAAYWQEQGDEDLKAFFVQEGRDLIAASGEGLLVAGLDHEI